MKILGYLMVLTVSVLLISCAGIYQPKEKIKIEVDIVPRPVRAEKSDYPFIMDSKTVIQVLSPELKPIGTYLSDQLANERKIKLNLTYGREPADRNAIVLSVDPSLPRNEGYELVADHRRIQITGKDAAGVFYGVQTLFQLVPVDPDELDKNSQISQFSIPGVRITDYPRFSWRGMHLDVCRHFFPKEFVKRYIDLMVMHKMNRFHWHLTEDQGWRIEIKKYPKLGEISAWRVDRENQPWDERTPPRLGEKATYGGYYTQDEIREIVAYAKERFVTVIPEIEMPAHATAALAAYPEFSCTGGPFYVIPGGVWPIVDIYCAGNEKTFEFLENVLGEVIDLFPGKYIHVGGDEAAKDNWKKCPQCQARIRTEGLKNENELQSYFIRRIERFLISKNKKLIGWDEILEGGLAPEATVMSWRGMDGGIAAAQAGHDVVMTPTSHCYFDYYQAKNGEPLAIGGFLPLEKVYEFEPVPDDMKPEQQHYILGAQGNVWTEYISTPEYAEYMAFPRACALAEVVWSPRNVRDLDDFLGRMMAHYKRLDLKKVHYRPPAQR